MVIENTFKTRATLGIVPRAYITKNTDSFLNWYDSGLVDLYCREGITYFPFDIQVVRMQIKMALMS